MANLIGESRWIWRPAAVGILFAILLAVTVGPASAAVSEPTVVTEGASTETIEEAAQVEHEGGLPQLNPEVFAPQIVWLAITFIILYLLMSNVALPRIAEVLEERQERIADDLDKASALRDESEQVVAAYEKALAEARSRAQGITAEATGEIGDAAAVRQAQFAEEMASKARAAEERIREAKDAALANVQAVAADVAQDIASKLAGLEVDWAAAEGAVAAAMKERG